MLIVIIYVMVEDTANGAGDLGLIPRLGRIGQSVANGSPSSQPQRFFVAVLSWGKPRTYWATYRTYNEDLFFFI